MKIKFLTLFVLPLSLFFTLSSMLNPNNPPAGRTGAPGETTCQANGCHGGGTFTGTVEITGVPDTIVSEETYSITLTNASTAIRAGFQLTALNGSNTKMGTLTAGTGSSIANAGGRQYVRQSTPKTLNNGSAAWSFTWKAPITVEGDSVHFYFTSLCANGNGGNTGDNVLVGKRSVVMPTPVLAVGDVEETAKMRLTPNPASDFLNIEAPIAQGQLKVLDANGRLVLHVSMNGQRQIAISQLPSGLYFVKFEGKAVTWTEAFVKK